MVQLYFLPILRIGASYIAVNSQIATYLPIL